MAAHGGGGIGTYLENLLPRVVAARPQWSFTLLGDSGTMTAQGWNAFPNVRLRAMWSPYYTVAEQIELPLRCPANTDIYWAPHYNVPLFLRHRTVVTIHDLCHVALPDDARSWLKQGYARFMFSHIGRQAAAIVFDSEFTRAEMARFAPPRGRTAVAHLAVDESWFCARERFPEPPIAQPYLVYVGNWKRHKNVPALMRAFKRVRDRIPHRLVLIGRRDGLNADEGIDVEAASLGDRLTHLGSVDASQLRQWVAHADALVTTSLYEGFGLPPIEAMAAGTPCLVSNAGSLPEVCGDAALYCDPRNDDDIASRIVEIASNASLKRSLIELGLARARAFSWDRSAAITLDMLEHAAQ